MFPVAIVVLALGCGLRFIPSLPAFLVEPWVLAGVGMLVWTYCGPAPALATLTLAWIILNQGWELDRRLDPALVGQDIVVTGTICDFPRQQGRATRFMLYADQEGADAVLPGRLYLASYGAVEQELRAGQHWRFKVRLKRPRGLSNPGAFDFERWALERRIGATGYVRKSAINRLLPTATAQCPSIRLRRNVANAIEAAVGSPHEARFLLALAVGARHRLTQTDWALFRRSGTSHLMAISGLHVGLVAALLLWVGRGFGLLLLRLGIRCAPLFLGRALAVAGAGGYALLAGFSVPTTRAFAMVAVAAVLTALRRELGHWQILAAAAMVVVWLDPLALFGSGFWLSFGAVTLLMLGGQAIPSAQTSEPRPGEKTLRRLRVLATAQVSLSVGLAPLVLLFFAQVPLLAPLINLVLVPLFAALIVPLILAGTLGLAVVPPIAGLLLGGAALLLDAGFAVLAPLVEWPGATWQQSGPGSGWMLLAGVGVVLLAWPRPVPLRFLGAIPLVAIVMGLARPAQPPLRIVVMDVGQGLAVLVQTPERALLYDAGPGFGHRDAGQSVVLPVLRYFGVERLHLAVVSHGDNDHIGGMRTVLEAFPQATLLATEHFGLMPRAFIDCEAGMKWQWGAVRLQILSPGRDASVASDSENDRSCVLSVATQAASLLLPGDIERRAERGLVEAGLPGPFDLVIAPHHGSATSSSSAFVAGVNARVVVFATGFGNRWKFPRAVVKDRWRKSGACLLDTATAGALVFEAAEGDRLRLVSMQRLAGRRLWSEGIPPLGCDTPVPRAAL
jgi:competence protein ComEC